MNGPVKLTARQRKALIDAEKVILAVLDREGEVLMTSFHHGWSSICATYFTPSGVQFSSLWTGPECTLADKVERALEHRFHEETNADQLKAERIERLKSELATLTGEAA